MLPTGELRFLRSDFPGQLSDEEVAFLRNNNVLTIVDLRGIDEAKEAPCRLEKEQGFAYLHMPVTVPGKMPSNQEEFAMLYAGMVDDHLKAIVDTIVNAKTNALFFCGSGQDRTGVVSAAVLKRLGYDDDVIIRDYMETKGNLQPIYEAWVAKNPALSLDLLLPNEKYIKKALEKLSK